MTSALFPKFVGYRGTSDTNFGKSEGTSKFNQSNAAFRFEVPAMKLPRVGLVLKIGGTGLFS
jgi:hypothetical protein